MAVQIQDVLALLPELFPGVQQIPYANIHPNPDNPGAPLSDQEIQELADNIADRGLVNPIKVEPRPVKPLVEGVKPHPENPRVTAEGRPWALGDFNWQILAGERRYRAAGRLKWAAIPGFILNPTAEEAVEITHLDNDVRARGWWAGYQSIEQLIKANPSLTQGQVATKLKMDRARVNRALSLLPLLNPEAKRLISANCTNSNKGILGISESAVLRLADLGPVSTLKPGVKKAGDDSQKLWPYPAIPADTQDLVRRTLAVAIDEELTEAGVRGLVGWVQDGHQPEDYKVKTKPPAKVLEREEDLETDEEEDEDSKPIPWSENSKQPVYLKIPVSRTRVHTYLTRSYAHSLDVERKARVMQATRHAEDILVRPLTEEEKKADPDHDYELFHGIEILKAAEKLGWPLLTASIFDINEWEGIRLHEEYLRFSQPLSWVEVYAHMENILSEDSNKTVGQLAIAFQENPVLAVKVLPVMKLLNESSRKMIWQRIQENIEDGIDMGGWQFNQIAGIELRRLEGFSKNLQETQRMVERVIGVLVEEEDRLRYLDEVIDWVLNGNDPDDYFEKEA